MPTLAEDVDRWFFCVDVEGDGRLSRQQLPFPRNFFFSPLEFYSLSRSGAWSILLLRTSFTFSRFVNSTFSWHSCRPQPCTLPMRLTVIRLTTAGRFSRFRIPHTLALTAKLADTQGSKTSHQHFHGLGCVR